MRNKTLLITGLVLLVVGLVPGLLPIIFAVYGATIGGAMVILAAVRFPFALALGWPRATVVTGVLAIAQYGAFQFVEMHKIFRFWTEIVAWCGGVLLLLELIQWLRERRRRERPLA